MVRDVELFGTGPAHDGGFWLASSNKLLRYRNGVETAQRNLAERPAGYWSLFEDSRSNVWICTYNRGVCRVTPDGEFRRWTALTEMIAERFPDPIVKVIFGDKSQQGAKGTPKTDSLDAQLENPR